MVAIGEVVTFVDPHGVPHQALVTQVWGDNSIEERNKRIEQWFADRRKAETDTVLNRALPGWLSDEALQQQLEAPYVEPSINCVLVVSDETQMDSYGRQIERRTSVPARSAQPAPGMYWFK